MKKALFMIAAAAAMLCCSCTKDLEDRVGNLEKKVEALEKQVETNVKSIEQLLAASAKAVTISSVEKTDNGYIIHFSDNTTATITDGNTPVIGLKEDNGVFYWTVDGEFLKNNGANVPVTGEDGKTPQFKIEDGTWKVSFDGATWAEVPVTGTVTPTLVMTETDTAYIFTLGETVITIEKENVFAIKVTFDEKNGFAGDKIAFDYTITGADEATKVYVESKGYEYKLDKENNKLYVTVPTVADEAGYIVLKAVRNSDGKSSAQYITIVLESRYGTFGGVIIKDDNPYKEW